MLKKIFILIVLLSTFFFSLSFLKIEKERALPVKINITKKEKKETIGKIIIKKINLVQNLYQINHSKNNVEENVTILDPSIFPDQKNSIVFLAAHSGDAKNSYFERLDELEINDEIVLQYNHNYYYYFVKEIYEEKKNGYINVNKDIKNQVILTTCSPKKEGYQLIINSIEKESI